MLKGFLCVWALAATAVLGMAQEWEIGALGGYGFSRDLTVNSRTGNAATGFENGGAIGVFGGHDTYKYWSGEARYLYRYSDLKLASGGTEVHFGGHQHIVHADFLAHFRPRGSRMRPFFAFGGGMKVLQGTGIESAAQPLNRFAALTATRETHPVADVGVGVKFQLSKYARFRIEVRDYLSPAPSKVIAPAPGASIGGWYQDVMGLAGLSLTW